MRIREWILKPYFWWKKRKSQQITAKVMQETGCDIHDIGGGGLDPEKVAVFKKRLQHEQNADEGIIVNVWPDPLETDKTMKIAAKVVRQQERIKPNLDSWPYLDRPTKTYSFFSYDGLGLKCLLFNP